MDRSKNKKMFRYSVDYFVELLCKVKKRKVNYKCNNGDTAAWNNFILDAPKNIGETYMKQLIEYGIQSYFNDSCSDAQRNNIRFSWMISESALKRWKKTDIKTNVYVTRIGLKKHYDVNVSKHKSKLCLIAMEIRPVEESFKSRFFNTKKGLLWCIANTTLYYHKSSYCASCKFKNECKDILKENYPNIYKKRGYDIR